MKAMNPGFLSKPARHKFSVNGFLFFFKSLCIPKQRASEASGEWASDISSLTLHLYRVGFSFI